MKTKSSFFLITFSAIVMALTSGCSSMGDMSHNTGTTVDLKEQNYKIIQTDVSGKSYGFSLLGIIPIVSPTFSAAKQHLYESIGQPITDRAVALANQTEDRSSLYLILFSIPRIMLTADIIEFDSPSNQNAAPQASSAAQSAEVKK